MEWRDASKATLEPGTVVLGWYPERMVIVRFTATQCTDCGAVVYDWIGWHGSHIAIQHWQYLPERPE